MSELHPTHEQFLEFEMEEPTDGLWPSQDSWNDPRDSGSEIDEEEIGSEGRTVLPTLEPKALESDDVLFSLDPTLGSFGMPEIVDDGVSPCSSCDP